MKFFDAGESEGVKLTVHAASGLLAGLCLGYNLIALCRRREKHLAVNTLLYGAIVVVEAHKIAHHWRAVAR